MADVEALLQQCKRSLQRIHLRISAPTFTWCLIGLVEGYARILLKKGPLDPAPPCKDVVGKAQGISFEHFFELQVTDVGLLPKDYG